MVLEELKAEELWEERPRSLKDSLYKLFWIFVFWGFLGYVVEMLFCYVKIGSFESRQGLIYGPFSQIYGFGAVLIVLALTPVSKKGGFWLFLGSALLGGIFEYLCSIIQEFLVGTVSWQYTEFSVSGRTSFKYMLYWGVLGFVFIRNINPVLSEFIDKVPRRQGAVTAGILAAALTANMAISGAAVYRWTEREEGVLPSGAFDEFLDRHYPDEKLEEIYPNMTIVKKE